MKVLDDQDLFFEMVCYEVVLGFCRLYFSTTRKNKDVISIASLKTFSFQRSFADSNSFSLSEDQEHQLSEGQKKKAQYVQKLEMLGFSSAKLDFLR